MKCVKCGKEISETYAVICTCKVKSNDYRGKTIKFNEEQLQRVCFECANEIYDSENVLDDIDFVSNLSDDEVDSKIL